MKNYVSKGLATAGLVFICAVVLLIPSSPVRHHIDEPDAPPLKQQHESLDEAAVAVDAGVASDVPIVPRDVNPLVAGVAQEAVAVPQYYESEGLTVYGSVEPEVPLQQAVNTTVEASERFRAEGAQTTPMVEENPERLGSTEATAMDDRVGALVRVEPRTESADQRSITYEREPVRTTPQIGQETQENALSEADYDQYLAAAVERRNRDLQHCYQRLLRTDVALSGRLTVAFTIDEEGLVSDIDMSTSELSEQFLDCAEFQIENWTFEPPGTQITVWKSYHFTMAGS